MSLCLLLLLAAAGAGASLLLLQLLAWWRGPGGAGWRRLRRCGELLPGPPTLPLLGNIRHMGTDPNEILPILMNLWKTYGSLFRLWAGPFMIVILLDPRDVEVLLTCSKNIKKAFTYTFLDSWLGQGLLTSTGKRWHIHRKIITPAFHFRILEQFLGIFNKQGDVLISLLKEKEEGKLFDIFPLITLCTQDVISESAMGVELHAQVHGYKSPYVNAIKRMCEIIMKRSSKPWLYLNSVYNVSKLRREEQKNLNIVHAVTNNVIRERRTKLLDGKEITQKSVNDLGVKTRLAFLDHLLTSEDCKTLSDTDIREEVDTFMFEGHDTTASAISFALMELSRRPDIQEKIYSELKEVFAGNSDFSLSMNTLMKLKYLEQVVKETLRLYPSVPLFGRELTNDLELSSLPVSLPPGTIVVVPLGLLHRHPTYFPEPDTFNPENFSSEAVLRRHPFSYVPFSAGSRNCIGQKFAMLELKTTLAKIVWNFSLQIDPKFELTLLPHITLKSRHGVKLSLRRRLQN